MRLVEPNGFGFRMLIKSYFLFNWN
jgi:hypothetical protein